LTEHGFNDVRQTEIHTAQPLAPEPSSFHFETAVEKLKICKSPGIDQIPAEFTQPGGNTLRSDIQKLSNFIWNKKNWQSSGRNLILYLLCDER
jgi:hypothetical protein